MRLSRFTPIDRRFAPAPDPQRTGWLGQWTNAHRGLHGAGENGARVENSASAFRAAIAAGLGIECDIQLSADAVPMVFHDWDFARLIGRPDRTDALTAAEWRTFAYLESEDAPIALSDLLGLVGGRVPLLIEIKSRAGYDVERSVAAVVAALGGYGGHHAVMSFDPRVSRWLCRHSPETLRGLVMREDEVGMTQSAWQRHLALWIARPEFLAYHIAALPNPMVAGLAEAGLPLLSWTVDTPQLLERARSVGAIPIAEAAGLP